MKARSSFFLCAIALFIVFLGMLSFRAAGAAPAAQFVTATPGPDGRIMYTVVEGDSCLQVALLHNITVKQLRQFNTRLD